MNTIRVQKKTEWKANDTQLCNQNQNRQQQQNNLNSKFIHRYFHHH